MKKLLLSMLATYAVAFVVSAVMSPADAAKAPPPPKTSRVGK